MSFIEVLAKAGRVSVSVGMLLLVVVTTSMVIYKPWQSDMVANTIFGVSILLIFCPFLGLQFFLPSGLMKDHTFGNMPVWGNIALFLFFPVINMIIITAVNSVFHFLSEYYVMSAGRRMAVEPLLLEQYRIQFFSVVFISYAAMLAAGISFKAIFGRRLKIA